MAKRRRRPEPPPGPDRSSSSEALAAGQAAVGTPADPRHTLTADPPHGLSPSTVGVFLYGWGKAPTPPLGEPGRRTWRS